MATRVWQGGAASVAQVDSLTPASVGIGNTFTATAGAKSVSFVATAATVANVTAGLAAAIAASAEPEFQQVTATDNTTNVLVTGPRDGTPFTLTASATGGTATLTRASVTAPVSPNDFATAANWSGAAVPVSGDTVIYDGTSTVDCLYGLNQSAVTGVTLYTNPGYTGNIGLPERNQNGFQEYRTTYLRIGATTFVLRGSGTVKLDTGSGGTAGEVATQGGGTNTEGAQVLWKGTGTNAVNCIGGDVGLALLPGEAATLATLRVGNGATVTGGLGLTLTDLTQAGGTVTLNNGASGTANKTAGTLTVLGGNCAAVNNDGGDLFWLSGGNITGTLNTSQGGNTDLTGDMRPMTINTCVLNSGAKYNDGNRRATYTNAPVFNRCSFADVDANFGTHIQITIAAGP